MVSVADEDIQVATLNIGYEGEQHLLDVCLYTLDHLILGDKLLFANLHTHELAEVVVVHNLTRLLDCFQELCVVIDSLHHLAHLRRNYLFCHHNIQADLSGQVVLLDDLGVVDD